MRRAALAAIREYLQLVRRAVSHKAVHPLTADAAPDPEPFGPDVDLSQLDQSASWPNILARTILPEITTIITGLGPQDLAPAAVTSITAWRAQWLADRTQVLVGVPDTITSDIRDAIQASADEHGPNPARAAQIVDEMLNPDAPRWAGRAQTIARTEVIGANNQGSLASWRAVHDSLTAQGTGVLKTWLATEDRRTREEHAAIDGTEIPIGQTFNVGGSQMDGPGDPGADPGLVINCRCTLTYRVLTDAAVDDSSDSILAAVEAPVTAPADAPPVDAPAAPPISSAPTPAVAEPGVMQWEGPILPLDVPSPDGRMFLSAGMTIRDLPLPISYQAEGTHGGDEAGTTVVVGRQLTSTVADGVLSGSGDFFDPMISLAPTAAIEQVSAGIGFVSANIAVKVMSYVAPGPDGVLIPIDPMQFIGDPMTVVCVAEEWEYMGCCIVDQPAFGQARITLKTDPSAPSLGPVIADAATPAGPILTSEDITFPDGTVLKVGDQVNIAADDGSDPTTGTISAINPDDNSVTVTVDDGNGGTQDITVDASALQQVNSDTGDDGTNADDPAATPLTAASAFPALEQEHVYPADWFDPVALDGPTAITITDDGRVYGHLAIGGTCHANSQAFGAQCVTPPSSPTNYAHFHVGEAKTDRGLLPVGKLTVGGGHADLRAGWRGAVEHYDNAGAAVAVVRAYEDEHGIQVAGSLLPTATADQISALRRSPLSGDWRVIGGRQELIAALSVNTPGFLVPRVALVASSGEPFALVAAGVVHAPAGDGDPASAGVRLPSGVELSAGDVAVLASAFADVTEQRNRSEQERRQRAENGQALRRNIESNRLKSRLLKAV